MNKNIIKFKLFKIEKDTLRYYYDCDRDNVVLLGGTKWNELPRSEYLKLAEAANKANKFPKSKWYYIVVIDVDQEDYEEVFDTAQQFIDWQEKEEREREAREEERKAKTKQAALARKKKQFEKLKKELGEEIKK